jgi:hypothetical protein
MKSKQLIQIHLNSWIWKIGEKTPKEKGNWSSACVWVEKWPANPLTHWARPIIFLSSAEPLPARLACVTDALGWRVSRYPARALLGMRMLPCGPSMLAPSSPPRLNRKAPQFTRLAACDSSSRAQKSRHRLTHGICALQNPTCLGRFSPRLWLAPWPGQPPPLCSTWWAGSVLDGIWGRLKCKCGSLCPIDQQTSTVVPRRGLWALAPWEFRRVEFVVELSSTVHVARWVFPPMKSSRLPRPLALNSSRNPAPGRAWAHRRRAAPPRVVRLRPGGSAMALRRSFQRCTVVIRSQFTFFAWLDQNRWYFHGWLGWHRSISSLRPNLACSL